jgi:hypothetical protein
VVLVSPLPGATHGNVLGSFRHLASKLSILRTGPDTGESNRWLVDYLDWVNEAARMLRSQVSASDIERLVLTKRYELLLSMVAPVSHSTDSKVVTRNPASQVLLGAMANSTPDPVVNGLLGIEVEERVAAFDEVCTTLVRQFERWSRVGVSVVLDTTVYMTHPDKLESLDFSTLAEVRDEAIHVLVPMVVVEELDNLKQRGNDHGPVVVKSNETGCR